jgi:hypothetical protein
MLCGCSTPASSLSVVFLALGCFPSTFTIVTLCSFFGVHRLRPLFLEHTFSDRQTTSIGQSAVTLTLTFSGTTTRLSADTTFGVVELVDCFTAAVS